MYPRISSGSPLDPWRRVQGDVEGSQKAGRSIFLPKRCQKTSSAADELKPMYADAEDPQLYKEVGYILRYLCSLFLFYPYPSYLIFSFLFFFSNLISVISSHLISLHLITSCLISPRHVTSHLISSLLISSHLISSLLISSHLISHLFSSRLISSYHPLISFHGTYLTIFPMLAPIVQRLHNFTHWINHYPADKLYRLKRMLSAG